jgi:hypothetical protein
MSARQYPGETISKEATSLLGVCTTLGRLGHFAALVSQQLGQQSALGLAVQDPLDLADRLALDQIGRSRSFQCRSQCVSQRQR